jgi:hypothetical protein
MPLCTKDELSESKIAKTTLKIIALFHPDKAFEEDIKTRVLREEITKYLNAHYQIMKGII